MRWDLRHSLVRATLAAPPPPPHPHLSLTNSLSALVCCHMTCDSSVCSYISQQTGKNTLKYHQIVNEAVNPSFPPSVPSVYSLSHLLICSSSAFLSISAGNPQVSLHGQPFICLSLSLVIPLQLCFCGSDIPLSLHPHASLFLFFFLSEGKSLRHSVTGRELLSINLCL